MSKNTTFTSNVSVKSPQYINRHKCLTIDNFGMLTINSSNTNITIRKLVVKDLYIRIASIDDDYAATKYNVGDKYQWLNMVADLEYVKQGSDEVDTVYNAIIPFTYTAGGTMPVKLINNNYFITLDSLSSSSINRQSDYAYTNTVYGFNLSMTYTASTGGHGNKWIFAKLRQNGDTYKLHYADLKITTTPNGNTYILGITCKYIDFGEKDEVTNLYPNWDAYFDYKATDSPISDRIDIRHISKIKLSGTISSDELSITSIQIDCRIIQDMPGLRIHQLLSSNGSITLQKYTTCDNKIILKSNGDGYTYNGQCKITLNDGTEFGPGNTEFYFAFSPSHAFLVDSLTTTGDNVEVLLNLNCLFVATSATNAGGNVATVELMFYDPLVEYGNEIEFKDNNKSIIGSIRSATVGGENMLNIDGGYMFSVKSRDGLTTTMTLSDLIDRLHALEVATKHVTRSIDTGEDQQEFDRLSEIKDNNSSV